MAKGWRSWHRSETSWFSAPGQSRPDCSGQCGQLRNEPQRLLTHCLYFPLKQNILKAHFKKKKIKYWTLSILFCFFPFRAFQGLSPHHHPVFLLHFSLIPSALFILFSVWCFYSHNETRFYVFHRNNSKHIMVPSFHPPLFLCFKNCVNKVSIYNHRLKDTLSKQLNH